MLALLVIEMCSTFNGQVIRFGGTGGPDDFLWIGMDQGSDLFACMFDCIFTDPAVTM